VTKSVVVDANIISKDAPKDQKGQAVDTTFVVRKSCCSTSCTTSTEPYRACVRRLAPPTSPSYNRICCSISSESCGAWPSLHAYTESGNWRQSSVLAHHSFLQMRPLSLLPLSLCPRRCPALPLPPSPSRIKSTARPDRCGPSPSSCRYDFEECDTVLPHSPNLSLPDPRPAVIGPPSPQIVFTLPPDDPLSSSSARFVGL
jgi:hypothetical protein